MTKFSAAQSLPITSLAILTGATAANAAIIYNDSNLSFGPSSGTSWDIDGDTTPDAMGVASSTGTSTYLAIMYADSDLNFLVSVSGSVPMMRPVPAGLTLNQSVFTSVYSFMAYGFLHTVSGYASNFTNGESNYIGFAFTQGSSGPPAFGWASITPNFDSNTYTIHEWAYEDSGDPIQVGAVPEPAETAMGLGALALGAAGLRHWRKQRKAA